MWWDRLAWLSLSIFLLLFGILHVTNVRIVWAEPIMGFAALVAGVIFLLRSVYPTSPPR